MHSFLQKFFVVIIFSIRLWFQLCLLIFCFCFCVAIFCCKFCLATASRYWTPCSVLGPRIEFFGSFSLVRGMPSSSPEAPVSIDSSISWLLSICGYDWFPYVLSCFSITLVTNLWMGETVVYKSVILFFNAEEF